MSMDAPWCSSTKGMHGVTFVKSSPPASNLPTPTASSGGGVDHDKNEKNKEV